MRRGHRRQAQGGPRKASVRPIIPPGLQASPLGGQVAQGSHGQPRPAPPSPDPPGAPGPEPPAEAALLPAKFPWLSLLPGPQQGRLNAAVQPGHPGGPGGSSWPLEAPSGLLHTDLGSQLPTCCPRGEHWVIGSSSCTHTASPLSPFTIKTTSQEWAMLVTCLSQMWKLSLGLPKPPSPTRPPTQDW